MGEKEWELVEKNMFATFSISLWDPWNIQSFVRLSNIDIPLSLGLMSSHFTYSFWHFIYFHCFNCLGVFFPLMISKYIPPSLQFLSWAADLYIHLTTDSPTWISHRHLEISMSKIYFIILPLPPILLLCTFYLRKLAKLLPIDKFKKHGVLLAFPLLIPHFHNQPITKS